LSFVLDLFVLLAEEEDENEGRGRSRRFIAVDVPVNMPGGRGLRKHFSCGGKWDRLLPHATIELSKCLSPRALL
jgi:hypothetical protein